MLTYEQFLSRKTHEGAMAGFEPVWMPSSLIDFQAYLTTWGIRRGRPAVFADCGMGKSWMEAVWSENVVRYTNRPVLLVTPLAVSRQMLREAAKVGVECIRMDGGKPPRPVVVVTNYEKLHRFDPEDFAGVACDESSILKSFDGQRRAEITAFMRKRPYRSLWTATAAPNDYVELGTSSEALGELGHMDMLSRFFANDQNTSDLRRKWRLHRGGSDGDGHWRFKGHAERPFWRWVCSWARAARRPSDLGFDDDAFVLPPLEEREHVIEAKSLPPGMLFARPAVGLAEEREERRRTIRERCEFAARLVDHPEPALVACTLNDEADLLEEMIPAARQVKGGQSDEEKEELFEAFLSGQLRTLVTKHKMAAWGHNFQHCAHVVTFATHSYEQYYQLVRRCWRFRQTRKVVADVVATEGEARSLAGLRRKAEAADRMFRELVAHMNDAMRIGQRVADQQVEVPAWL